MILVNKTKGVVLAQRVEEAANFSSRLVGLLGRASMDTDEALHITRCGSVHTCFMRFAIDVLFMDPHNRVLKAVENLAPYRICFGPWRTSSVWELPAGRIDDSGSCVGDILAVILDGFEE
ncbi:MAG: hypothetical protein CSA26_06495 [Desulfobacterales bacterium]|nr:MAG: hypothetical protein CSA26_06495 [Desulfobacterales bacterium]